MIAGTVDLSDGNGNGNGNGNTVVLIEDATSRDGVTVTASASGLQS